MTMGIRERTTRRIAALRAALARRPALARAAAGASVLAGGALIAAGLVATGAQPDAAEPEERAWPVSVERVVPAPLAPTVTSFGRVEAASVTSLEARVSAPVASVEVREGERVSAGDLLLRLDATEAELTLTAREADVVEARADLATTRNEASLLERTGARQAELARMGEARRARFESLHEQGMIARELLEESLGAANRTAIEFERHQRELADLPHRIARAEARLQRAEVARDRARLDVERTELRAPFSGPVTAVRVARGDQVMTGTPLVTLVDTASFEVRVPLAADHAVTLRRALDAGQPVYARAELEGVPLRLPLARLAGDLKPGSTVVDAFFPLPADAAARVGAVIDVDLTLPAREGLVALPVQAVYESDRLYRVDGERLYAIEARIVGESRTGGEYRVLVDAPGLAAGDRIVTTQLPQAMSGLRVKPAAGAPSGGVGALSAGTP